MIAPYSPDAGNILNANAPASAAHLLGTDAVGRDILSRLIYGARLSLLGPALIIAIATTAGVTLAISAVWIGGWYDLVVGRILDLLFAIPGLLVAIIAVAVLGAGLLAPVLALSLAYTPYIARVLRSVALRERHLAYIESCQLVGYSGWAICRAAPAAERHAADPGSGDAGVRGRAGRPGGDLVPRARRAAADARVGNHGLATARPRC